MKLHLSPLRALVFAGSVFVPLSLSAADAPSVTTTPAAAPAADIELKDPVAEVNGKSISKADLENAFKEAVGGAGIDPAMLSAEQKLAGYRQILEDMVTDMLVTAKAEEMKVSEEDVKAEIEKIKGQFPSPEVFEEQLKQSGQSLDKLQEMVTSGMKQRLWVESQVKEDVSVTDEDAKKFYEENTAEFAQPEQVQASHILFLVPEDASPEVVKEKEEAAKAALERAKKGEDFTALAKELSEEPGADQSGGDLGFFTKERMVPEFAEAAFSQAKDEISGLVKTDFGFHIIKVTDKKPAGTLSFDEVKDQLKNFLEGGKRQEAITKVIDKLRSEADVVLHLPEPPAAAAPAEGSAPQAAPATE